MSNLSSDLCISKTSIKRLETHHLRLFVREETGLSISSEITEHLDGVSVTPLVRIYPVVTCKTHRIMASINYTKC